MATHPIPETTRVRREAMSIHVGRDIAWATFDQYVTGAGVPLMDLAEELDRGVWPQHGGVPVVLGMGRGEPAEICWVIARDGRILVALNDKQLTDERLAAAASIYGLTPAQLRLAGLIVDGHSLVEAARVLRASQNTARTHLRRMFERTGVRSQAALVVALLAAAMPLG